MGATAAAVAALVAGQLGWASLLAVSLVLSLCCVPCPANILLVMCSAAFCTKDWCFFWGPAGLAGTQSGDPSKLRDPEEVYKATLQPLQVSLLLNGVLLDGGYLAKRRLLP